MKPNILRANLWRRIPRVRFHAYDRRKIGPDCYKDWFHFERYWGGKLWYFTVRRFQMIWDFRECFQSDMMFPNTTKEDQETIREVTKLEDEG